MSQAQSPRLKSHIYVSASAPSHVNSRPHYTKSLSDNCKLKARETRADRAPQGFKGIQKVLFGLLSQGVAQRYGGEKATQDLRVIR